MAKKEEKSQEAVEAPKEETAHVEAPKTKAKAPVIIVGMPVQFFVNRPQSNGKNLIAPLAATIIGRAAEASNFKPEDGAVDMVYFTERGYMQTRFGVRFSSTPKEGFWSHLPQE